MPYLREGKGNEREREREIERERERERVQNIKYNIKYNIKRARQNSITRTAFYKQNSRRSCFQESVSPSQVHHFL